MGGIAVVDSVEGAEVVWVATWASGSLAWGGTVDAVLWFRSGHKLNFILLTLNNQGAE